MNGGERSCGRAATREMEGANRVFAPMCRWRVLFHAFDFDGVLNGSGGGARWTGGRCRRGTGQRRERRGGGRRRGR